VGVVQHLDSVDKNAIRVIDVPFDLSASGSVEVGSIPQTVPLDLPQASYLLRCEFLNSMREDVSRVRLLFAREEIPHFSVAVADKDLIVEEELLTYAVPA
jgi:hypothetical protein